MRDDINKKTYEQFFLDGPYHVKAKIIHDPDYLMFDKLNYDRPLIFDVGGNKGQSIGSFLALFPEAEIHTFECNPAMLKVLNHTISECSEECRNVTLHNYGLSSQTGGLKFSTPVVDGVLYWEETTCLIDDQFEKHKGRYADYGKILGSQDFQAVVKRGDDLNLSPDIVKIDTEGSEHMVLSGLIETLKRSSPIVLAETSSYNEVNDVLFPLGYKVYMPEDATGNIVTLARGRGNVLYVHQARHADFKQGTFYP